MAHRKALLRHQDVYDSSESSETFVAAVRHAVEFHCAQNDFYREWLALHHVSPEQLQTEADLPRIPPIPANFYKQYESLSVSRETIVVHATSSGTSGQKSQMFFDQESWDFGQDMVRNIMRYYGFISESPCNYLLYTYEPAQRAAGQGELGTAKTDEGLMQYAPGKEVVYALRHNGSGHDFDVYGVIAALQRFAASGLPVRIFGFPAFLYFTLRQMRDMGVAPLRLHQDSMTMLGGGWKGHAASQVDKYELYALVEDMLGFPGENCRDGYGSTEHSVPYLECSHHNMHVPIYSRAYIRDFRTLEPLGFNREGFASFVTPHLSSVPAVSVLMGDKAILREADSCGCGIQAPVLEILGRAGTSQSMSCAIAASELLKK